MPTPPSDLSAIGDLERNPERSLQFEFVRATENAALACLPWLGRNAKETADDAASRAILGVLEYVDICGECVIGEGIKDNAPGIFIGDKLGTWAPGSWHVDVAVDPIDGTTNLSKGMPNSISVMAATFAPPGAPRAMMSLPSFYAEKLTYGPRVVEQMELPLDIALCFLQGNCILNASHSAPCLAYQTIKPSSTAMKKRRKKDSTDMHSLLEDSNSIFLHWRGISEASGVDIAAMVDALAVEQICATLTYFSDCDILLSKKYDSSFLMDRSSSSSGGGGSSGGVALFPEGYVSTICGKACAASKGSGFKELYERGQLGGFTGSFAAIHRPKSLDIRYERVTKSVHIYSHKYIRKYCIG